MKRLIALAFIVFASPAQAGSLGSVIGSVPGWEIYRGGDSFEGTLSCTAVQVNGHAQIADNGSIYISMRGRGGIKMTRMRYNESPPHDWVAYGYRDSDIMQIQPSKWQNDQRVRVQIYTVLRDTKNFDFDVSEAKQALAAVRACEASQPI